MDIGNWFVAKEGQGYCIRRRVGEGKQPRYPKTKYKHLKTLEELEALVNRLNHEEGRKAKERIEVRTSFIPVSIMEGFRAMLQVSVPNEKDFNYLYNTVFQSYFLNFFVTSLGLLDPKQWYREQEKWGAALLGKSEHLIFDMAASAKTLKTTIQTANRFMAFLHQKMPEDYPIVVFKPLDKAAIKDHEARRKLLEIEPVGQFVDLGDWIQINSQLPNDIAPFVRLMYYYGLRRAESLGFTSVSAIRRSHINVNTQLQSLSAGVKPLKSREVRSTPHWFCSPDRAYKLIQQSLTKKMHPDTLGVKWRDLMDKMGMSYDLHDMRRTFITRALRAEQIPRDVQLAVGHESLSTTMRYAQDDRNLDSDLFTPAS